MENPNHKWRLMSLGKSNQFRLGPWRHHGATMAMLVITRGYIMSANGAMLAVSCFQDAKTPMFHAYCFSWIIRDGHQTWPNTLIGTMKYSIIQWQLASFAVLFVVDYMLMRTPHQLFDWMQGPSGLLAADIEFSHPAIKKKVGAKIW